MNRLIIVNRSDLPMTEAMDWIARIMDRGRISNEGKQYCYAVRLPSGHVICSDLTKTGDKFTVLAPQ